MRQALVGSSVLGLGLLCSTAASADPITIITNSTGIAALAYTGERGVITTQSYPFNVNGNNSILVSAVTGGTTATASASIASDVGDLSRLRSSGSTNVSYRTQIGQTEARSLASFFVAFQLARAHEYLFSADFITSGGNTSSSIVDRSEWGFDLISLDPNRSREPALMIESGHDSTSVVRSGLLAPGLYRFNVQGTAVSANLSDAGTNSGSAFSNFAFSMDLTALDDPPTPTPEPASLLLIASGLGGILAVCRRTRLR
jgi:hypothetical protein